MDLSDDLIRGLEKAGVAPASMQRLLRDVATLVSSNARIPLAVLNTRLHELGWNGLKLDSDLFARLSENFMKAGYGSLSDEPSQDRAGLGELLDMVVQERGIDFRGYSAASLARRVRRRLDARGCSSFFEYQDLLAGDQDEYDRLLDEMTVNVTRFMRNPAAFRALERVMQSLLENVSQPPLTIWSAGCASGEEAYSLAILACGMTKGHLAGRVSIVGTDIDRSVLERAQRGIYDAAQAQELPRAWADEFFKRVPAGLAVVPKLREGVRFEYNNLVTDPPIACNIVVCRNVLIYFSLPLQIKVVEKFHSALPAGGHLLLGRYEMLLGDARRLFECVDSDARLYRKRQLPPARDR